MKAVQAQNAELLIKEHFVECLGKDNMKPGGNHRHDYLQDEEKVEIRSEIKRIKMFERELEAEKIKFENNIRSIWGNLTNENIDIFLQRNCGDYKLKKHIVSIEFVFRFQ